MNPGNAISITANTPSAAFSRILPGESPTVLILASGRGDRYRAAGGNTHKLEAMLAGREVLQVTISAARAAGLPLHLEQWAGHTGMGEALAAAVAATANSPGWLILPGDMPLVLASTLQAVAAAVRQGASAAQPSVDRQRGHPVGFASAHRQRLMSITGDQGARALLSELRATGEVVDVPCNDQGVLLDIDTPDDLLRATDLWRARHPQA
jgi:molybdenum cofactor cytidylyltransferase